MQTRRMLSKEIVGSDAFLSLSNNAQLLYFHLCLNADNRGYVSNARCIISMIVGLSISDLDELISHKFILDRSHGLYLIKHWYIHNDFPKGYVDESNYIEDLENLYFDVNNSYTSHPTKNPVLETIKVKKPFKENKIKEIKGKENEIKLNESKVNLQNSKDNLEEDIDNLHKANHPNDDDEKF